jgi:hypothetical protein
MGFTQNDPPFTQNDTPDYVHARARRADFVMTKKSALDRAQFNRYGCVRSVDTR